MSTQTWHTTRRDSVETVITVRVDKNRLHCVNILIGSCMREVFVRLATCATFNTRRLSKLKNKRSQKPKNNSEHSAISRSIK